MSKEKPVNRRAFFREGLRSLLGPLSAAVEPVERAVEQLGRMELHPPRHLPSPAVPVPPRTIPLEMWLRPPGAMPEQRFIETCSRCGECERVCPAKCIHIDPTSAKGNGAPYIEIDTMPCVVCDGLDCMQNCPTGALIPTPRAEIDMGLAVWDRALCVRTHGQDCTTCIDQCPLGAAAIQLLDGDVQVIEAGCIGCGVCQYYCPTAPKSITITPRSALPN